MRSLGSVLNREDYQYIWTLSQEKCFRLADVEGEDLHRMKGVHIFIEME